jgi:hypothetical protein
MTDGESIRRRCDKIVADVLEGRRRPSDRLAESLRTDGGESAHTDLDADESDRRARQAARSLLVWSRRAERDPHVVLDEAEDTRPRCDGGESDHYCEICEQPFGSVARLIKHDCGDTNEGAPLVTDGGVPEHVDDDLVDAVASIPDADVGSITQFDDGRGHFVIESDPDEQDVDKIDAALEGAGYERNGHLPVPGMTQQNFIPADDVDRGDGPRTDGGARIDWPPEWERTLARERSKNRSYEVSQNDAITDLDDELDRLGVDDWRLSTAMDHQSRNPNYPYSNQPEPDDPGVVCRWSMDGDQFAVACDAYSRVRDNLRTVGLYIREKRKMSGRPVTTGETEFANARLPSGEEDAVAADPPPYQVLGVDPDAP